MVSVPAKPPCPAERRPAPSESWYSLRLDELEDEREALHSAANAIRHLAQDDQPIAKIVSDLAAAQLIREAEALGIEGLLQL